MKHLLKSVSLAIIIAVMPAISNAAEQKIGIVFPSKIMKESPQRAQIIKKLESEFKDRYKALQKLEKEIGQIEKTLKRDAELMSKGEITASQRKIEIKLSEYKINRKAFEEDNRRRQGEEQQQSLMLVRKVINDIAKSEGYDLILNGEQIIFASKGFDISDLVIKAISKK